MQLNTRLMLYILTTSVLIFAAGIGYISFRYKSKAINDAKEIASSSTRENANLIKSYMDKDFGIARGIAEALHICENELGPDAEKVQTEILKKTLIDNPSYVASFLQWDLSDCDSSYHKYNGRRRYFCFRKYPVHRTSGSKRYLEIEVLKGLVDTISYDPQNPYYFIKKNPQEFIIDPYFYSYQSIEEMPNDKKDAEDAILETTIIIPITENNKFRAVSGVDIPLNHFRGIIKDIKPFNESQAFLISNNGTFVAYSDLNYLSNTFNSIFASRKLPQDIRNNIKKGKEFSFIREDDNGEQFYFMFSPVEMGNTNTPWSIGLVVPVKVIMAEANRHFYISLIVGLAGLIILSLIIWRISLTITKPIEATTSLLTDLSKGKIDPARKISVKTNDELQEMADSANILIDGLLQTATFAKQIGEGNLEIDYKLLSEDDILGFSLIEMREKLKRSKEEIEIQNKELQKLSMVAQRTDNAVMIMDSKGNLEWVNNAFEKMYGYNIDDFSGDKIKNLKDLSSHPDIENIIMCCATDTIFYESDIKSKSGKRVYAQTTITPIFDENGEVYKLVAIDSDISEIKKAQEKIEDQRDKLEVLNATKDKFFAIIAHDLKNPFTSLLSLSQTLSENFHDFDKEELQEFLKRVNKSAWQIFSLLENLLTWSRAQTGKIDYNPEKFHPKEIIDGTISLLSDTAKKKEVKLSSSMDINPSLYADKNMITMVVRNLLHNAVKFTNKSGTVNISADFNGQSLNGNPKMLKISISDNGIGISKVDLQKLFRIEIQTKSIGTSKEKGTGLGLILCKEFVEKNGGSISVESDEGKGSIFSFTVPVAE